MQKNTFKYVLDTYRIRPCSYVILTCPSQCPSRILTCQYHIRTVSIGQYLHVSAHILGNASLILPPASICSPALACAPARGRWHSLHVRLGAGARSLHVQVQVRRAVAAASSSRGQRGCRRNWLIINKFIQIRSARLDSCSRWQLEQQRLCCALKCLGAVGCQWSTTSRRQKQYR